MKQRRKLGLAFGAGGAKGLIHIGVLKALHKHKIYPDYIAGTSMGSVIGAVYAIGHLPEEIAELAKTTDWKSIVDFTMPKHGLIRGQLAMQRIRRLTHNKDFSELNVPLKVIAYDLSKKRRVVFSKGNVAEAVRASISIPGIFPPFRIDGSYYVDGAVAAPTPFETVKEMGAEVVIAVDLYTKEKKISGPVVSDSSLFSGLRDSFVAEELLNIKNYLFPTRWPGFIRKTFFWLFDKLFYPQKIIKFISTRRTPSIAKTIYDTMNVLTNNLARERLSRADVDIKITPPLGNLGWTDFDKVDQFVSIGEKAMEREINSLRRKLRK